jgi:hypothetical protein
MIMKSLFKNELQNLQSLTPALVTKVDFDLAPILLKEKRFYHPKQYEQYLLPSPPDLDIISKLSYACLTIIGNQALEEA